MLLLCQKRRASWHSLVPMQVPAEVKVCTSTQCHRPKSSQGPDRQIALTAQLQTVLSLAALPDLKHICILQFMFWFGWSSARLCWYPWPAAESPCAPRGCPADTKPLATTKGLLHWCVGAVCAQEGDRKGGGIVLIWSQGATITCLGRALNLQAVFLRGDATNASIPSKFHSPTDTGRQERSPWPTLLLRWFHAIQRKSRALGPGKENRSKHNKYP